MAAYVANFHKAYMPAETDSNDKGIEVRERDPEEPFFFEPTAAIYLIGPDGEYIGQFSQSADLEAMAEDLSKIVE
ncbi:MAG: hypothetical protein O2967_17915 [Proteobacteria bacterium]|nr:hypothetical protein [Pseudomonadota bacterium]